MSIFDETFEVVIVGTSTTHSILAGALALAGKKVLHIDRNEYYGGIDASFTMDQLVRFTAEVEDDTSSSTSSSSSSLHEEKFQEGEEDTVLRCDVENELVLMSTSCEGRKALEFLESRKRRLCAEAAQIAFIASKAASESIIFVNEQVELAKVISSQKKHESKSENDEISNQEKEDDEEGEKEKISNKVEEEKSTEEEEEEEGEEKISKKESTSSLMKLVSLLEKSRNFSLDLSPRLVLARGKLVDGMVRSNVHRYLEFTTLHCTCVGFRDDSATSTCSVDMKHVPSNKRDVFMCDWLTLREKRSLMHFLRFCMDYAFDSSSNGVDVTRQNETMLQQQRSLARPQNKKSASKSYDLKKYECFEKMLEASNMSEKLRSIVTYGLGFSNSIEPLKTQLAMKRVSSYVSSLGRHGTTAFLCMIYGAGEIPQSFCRLAAVNCAVYMLRERVRGLVIVDEDGSCGGVKLKGGLVKCNHVIMNACTLPNSYRTRGEITVVRTIAVLSKRIFQSRDEEKIRTLGVIVPGQGEDVAVRCLQVSTGVRACPKDHVILYMWITISSKDPKKVQSGVDILKRTLKCLVPKDVLYDVTYVVNYRVIGVFFSFRCVLNFFVFLTMYFSLFLSLPLSLSLLIKMFHSFLLPRVDTHVVHMK